MSISLTSCSRVTCTSRRSPLRAVGPTGSAEPGCSTPGARSAKIPARVEIDLDGRTAQWVSMMGWEQQSLDDADHGTLKARL